MAVQITPVTTKARFQTPRRARFLLAGIAVGLLVAVFWSADLVDEKIGFNVADAVLGHDATRTNLAGSFSAAVFAIVSGIAGSFTACNIAVFGTLPNIATTAARPRQRLRAILTPIGWVAAGLVAVAAIYGAIAVALGSHLPQLSSATIGGIPVRLLQSVIVFGVIGLAFLYLGMAELGLVPDPFAMRPRARLVTLGALVGGFLIGRPYPLFHELLARAVASHDPFYGAVVLSLQAIGNITLVAVIALVIAALGRGRAVRWLAQPQRAAAVAAVALLAVGTFLLVYWDIRLPAAFGYGWFPKPPWS